MIVYIIVYCTPADLVLLSRCHYHYSTTTVVCIVSVVGVPRTHPKRPINTTTTVFLRADSIIGCFTVSPLQTTTTQCTMTLATASFGFSTQKATYYSPSTRLLHWSAAQSHPRARNLPSLDNDILPSHRAVHSERLARCSELNSCSPPSLIATTSAGPQHYAHDTLAAPHTLVLDCSLSVFVY